MESAVKELTAVGIDIGSSWTKAVVLRGSEIAACVIRPTAMKMLQVADSVFREVCARAELSPSEVGRVVATGYGRVIVPWATKCVTEITCHAKGISWFTNSVRLLIDVGGQDTKVIRLDGQGNVVNFAMGDKCAAGTGRFIEVMANATGVPLDQMGNLALKSNRELRISSICTVFAESEVISLVSEGAAIEDILAGVFNAVAERTYHLARSVGLERDYAMSGGLAKNVGIVRALEKKLGGKLWIPPQPQVIGALGAALIAESL